MISGFLIRAQAQIEVECLAGIQLPEADRETQHFLEVFGELQGANIQWFQAGVHGQPCHPLFRRRVVTGDGHADRGRDDAGGERLHRVAARGGLGAGPGRAAL